MSRILFKLEYVVVLVDSKIPNSASPKCKQSFRELRSPSSMDSLEDLLHSQKEVAGRIDRFMDNTRKTGKQKMVGRFLKKRQQLLGDYWKELQDGHRVIACRSDAEGSDYLESDLYSQVEDAYLSQDVELDDMIRGPESPARPSSVGVTRDREERPVASLSAVRRYGRSRSGQRPVPSISVRKGRRRLQRVRATSSRSLSAVRRYGGTIGQGPGSVHPLISVRKGRRRLQRARATSSRSLSWRYEGTGPFRGAWATSRHSTEGVGLRGSHVSSVHTARIRAISSPSIGVVRGLLNPHSDARLRSPRVLYSNAR